jgi:hypothetical protein
MEIKSLPLILKSKDISSIVNKSPDDINYLARKGVIKGFKRGKQWRFKREDAEIWLKETLNQ